MVVKNKNGEPDIPDYLDGYVRGYTYRKETDDYKLKIRKPRISSLQGKIMLNELGLLENVESFIQKSDKKTQLAYENATVWERFSPTVIAVGNHFEIDLDDFFKKARDIEI